MHESSDYFDQVPRILSCRYNIKANAWSSKVLSLWFSRLDAVTLLCEPIYRCHNKKGGFGVNTLKGYSMR